MTFSSILSISIALLVTMTMLVIAINVDHISTSVENQLTLQVSLKPILSEEQIEQVGNEILEIPGVESAVYSSREQELEKLIEENGAMFAQYEDSNPLYNIYQVTISELDTLENVSAQIEWIDGVAQVDYGGSRVIQLVHIFDSMRTIGWITAIGLMLLGVFLIRNTTAMAISVREDEISIMRTVGAYNFYIITPFILEGMFIGFFAALIPALLIGIGYPSLYYAFESALASSAFSLYPPQSFLPAILAADFGAGLILGALGSWMAARKYLRRTR